MGDAKEIEIAGIKISRPSFKMSDVRDGMTISGDWAGTGMTTARSTFRLFCDVVGSIADLYSMYEFNERGFQQSLRLVRKNCVS